MEERLLEYNLNGNLQNAQAVRFLCIKFGHVHNVFVYDNNDLKGSCGGGEGKGVLSIFHSVL